MKLPFSLFRITLIVSTLVLLALMPGISAAKKTAQPPHKAFGLTDYRVAHRGENRANKLKYKDASGQAQVIRVYGAIWDLRAKYADNAARDAAATIVMQEAVRLGGENVFRDAKRALIKLTAKDNPNRITYLELLTGWNKEIRLYIYMERRLAPGVPVELELDFTNPDLLKTYALRADFDGKHYYTLEIEILKGLGVMVYEQNDLEDASPRIRYKTQMEAHSKYYKKYVIYDLDPYRCPHIFKVVRVKRQDKKKTRVRLTLQKSSFTVPALGKFSPKPGVFKLRNALTELPKLEPKGHINGDYAPTGDVLPDGDAIYWLNNGYYSFAINDMRTNLVPVMANHQTMVEWPLALSELKPGAPGKKGEASRMAVYDVEAMSNDRAQVDINISNLPKGLEPTADDFAILESGSIPGKVESIERLPEPINLVILLDSSGSMKRSMKRALKAVEDFINLLPSDANITLVDFDTKVKPIKAAGRAGLIKKLRKIRAGGATALYDSVIKAQKILAGKSRASVVLFTDGKDANYNDTARGSKADFNQMMKSVQGSKLPIYPIAFGKKADTATLQSIARLTKTAYYQGETKEKLAGIFADIASDLSSAFRVTYARGKRIGAGDQPVVNFMVDVSGSMDIRKTMRKNCEGCDYRWEQLKEMLAKSVLGLDDDTFIQISTFSHEFKTVQIITRDKAKLLAGIGAIEIGGGTDILGAVKRSLALSQVIPSNRRYLVFVTDAAGGAFNFKEDQQKELNANLLALKEAGVQCFWLGMWESPKTVEEMAKLAELSGGESFVSSDADKITAKVVELTERIKNADTGKAASGNTVEVRFNRRDAKTGELFAAVGHKRTDMPVLVSAKNTEIRDITYDITPMDVDRKSYNQAEAASIYGDDIPLKEVRVKKIIPLLDRREKPVSAQNKAMRMELSKAVLLDRLKGITPPSKKQFLVLDLNLFNILPTQKVVVLDDGSKHPSSWLSANNSTQKTREAIPTYRIPALKNHLFIRVNNGYEVPFHPITWALQEPLTQIDTTTVDIPGGGHKKGVLAFEIPNQNISALSLHFYDTDYGHIDLPLIGTMERKHQALAKLPKKSPAKLSDAFSLGVRGREYRPEIMGIKAPVGASFELLGLELDSKVNALLKLEPNKRFSLHIKSDKGEWILPPHELSARVPLGVYNDISLAPGSRNSFNLVFLLPNALKDADQELVVELKGRDKRIALGEGEADGDMGLKGGKDKPLPEALATGHADAISLNINKVYATKKLDGRNRQRILVDLTISDDQDGDATRMRNFLALSNAPKQNFRGRSGKMMGNAAGKKGLGNFSSGSAETENSKKFSFPDAESANRLLGCTRLTHDGNQKRCVLLFDPSKVDTKGDVYLISPIFQDLKYKLDLAKLPQLDKKDSYLLLRKLKLDNKAVDNSLKRLLAKVRQDRLNRAKLNRAVAQKAYSLDDGAALAQDVPPIPVSFSGGLIAAKIKDCESAVKALAGLKWVPSYHKRPMYSLEAMLTQGWGSEYDMLAALAPIIKRKRTEMETGIYPLTKAGLAELKARAAGIPLRYKQAIYLKWLEEGEQRDIVLPFLKPSTELAEFIERDKAKKGSMPSLFSTSVKFYLYYENAQAPGGTTQMGAMGSALSGGSAKKVKKVSLLSRSYAGLETSNMPLDFWFTQGKDERGRPVVRTYVSAPHGVDTFDATFKGKIVPQKLVMEIGYINGRVEPFVFEFKDGQKLEDIFLTASFTAPDLPKAAIKEMQAEEKRRMTNREKISAFSRLQWANRARIYSFIAIQARQQEAMAAPFKLALTRHKSQRVILALMEKTPDSKLKGYLDLRYVDADLYGDKKAAQSFRIGSGLFNAQAEAAATPGAQSLLEQWFKVDDQRIAIIMPGKNKHSIKMLEENGAAPQVLARLKKSRNVWLYPLKNNGEPIWLEVDPKTYHTVSMLKNGMHGAMTENKIIDTLVREGAQYFVGFFSGIGTSELTVASVSLFVEDYDKVLERSELIAGLIACGVGTISSMKSLKDGMSDAQMISGTIDITVSMGSCVNGDVARGAGVAKGMGYSLAGGDFKGDGIKSVLGFANGFGDGVTFYFKAAKETAHTH